MTRVKRATVPSGATVSAQGVSPFPLGCQLDTFFTLEVLGYAEGLYTR